MNFPCNEESVERAALEGADSAQNAYSDESKFSSRADTQKSADSIISQRLLNYGIVSREKRQIQKAPPRIEKIVDEVLRLLFVDGGHFENLESIMTNYCELVRKLDIPVDRLYHGGVALHPKLTAYLSKWELGDFMFREMPSEVFERRKELFGVDEPFCVLEQGRAEFVRIKASDKYIPPDTEKWFRGDNYQDYFALPDSHGHGFKGGVAWATKDPKGFSEDHIHFFRLTLPSLTTVMRLHTNDLVLRTLTKEMELEIEERTQELAQANLKLAKANDRLGIQAKKQLEHFACMSHEIRTPLNCIVGLSSLILESPEELTPSLADSIRMINSSADLLNGVVDDVLDYSKLESGVFEVDIRPTNLQNTLNDVVLAMQEKAGQRNVRICTHYGPTLLELIQTDARRLQQVLYNLLGNACKFSKPGGLVDLTVSMEEKLSKSKSDGSAGRILRLSVKDYGKGIATKDFESIFKPFNQASKVTQTVYGGTGLGLSITSKLVDRLGGTISVNSKLGEFAEFVVELSFHGTPIDVASLSSQVKQTTIVLLDDDTSSENHPFGPEVIEEYHLDFIRTSSWEEVNRIIVDEPGKLWKDQHYVLFCPSHLFNSGSFKKFSKRDRHCTLITFGRHGSGKIPEESKLHWVSLQRTFPTVALQSIARFVHDKSSIVDDCLDEVVRMLPTHLFTLEPTPLSEPEPEQQHPNSNEDSSDHRPPVSEIRVPSPRSSLMKSSQTSDKPLARYNNNNTSRVLLRSEPTIRSWISDLERNQDAEEGSESQMNTRSMPSPHGKTSLNTAASYSSLSTLDSTTSAAFRSPSLPRLTPRNLRVLYVEDNKINQKVLARMLARLGIEDLDMVDDGLQSVAASATKVYDIIFMDAQMPVMDGLEATKIIKARDGEKVKIIFCTAHAVNDMRVQAKDVGADGFISKPFNMKKIESILDQYEYDPKN
jgi:signal transduction histidine kinase/CheY-like chemotaxis protein